jgi:8-oxo-dGTP diphosphatase
MKIIHVVAAIMSDSQGRILIARRKKNKMNGGKWEFPGGKVDPGEDHITALKREMEEEFGIDVIVDKHFISMDYQYEDIIIRLHAYLVGKPEGHLQLLDHDEIAWVRREDLLDYDLAEADLAIAKSLLSNNGA